MRARLTRLEAAENARGELKVVTLEASKVRRWRALDNWALILLLVCSSVFAIGLVTRVFWPTLRPAVEASPHTSVPEGP